MSNIFELRERLQKFYSINSKYVDKALQFVMALLVFGLLGKEIGFMKAAANPLVILAVSLICAFLPVSLTVLAAAVMTLAHLYALSLGVAGVAAGVFFVMFVFYFKFTPKKAFILLITPAAFALKIPYIIPIAFGLVGTPVYIIPVTCGTIIYFMLNYVKEYSSTISAGGDKGMLGVVTTFAKQVAQNKEMWVTVVAFVLCLLIVYTVRRQSVNHSWEIGVIAGAAVNIIILAAADIVLNLHISYVWLIIGSVIAVIGGIVLELLFFAVDYSRTEHLQYEDDEYYYYVKAVPKIVVSAPVKSVKRINERQDTSAIDAEKVRKAARKKRF